MRLEIICLCLLVINAEDLSCFEDGGWRGLKVKPDPEDSDYTVYKEWECWDIENVSLSNQTAVCEALRVKNHGTGWSLHDDGSARWCTVYEAIMSEQKEDFTIRGVTCNASLATKRPLAKNSFYPTKFFPSFPRNSNLSP